MTATFFPEPRLSHAGYVIPLAAAEPIQAKAVTSNAPSQLTVGVIADKLDEKLHRVEYVIRTRSIKPASTAGHARVFTEADLQYIAAELRRIDAERGPQ